jgi:hypothetical protein
VPTAFAIALVSYKLQKPTSLQSKLGEIPPRTAKTNRAMLALFDKSESKDGKFE